MASKVAARPERTSFSRLDHVLQVPNLIDIQKASFSWFMEEGLRETINDISPIEDYTGTLAVEFGSYEFGDAPFTIKECREKDLTYEAPLSMVVRFVNKETGEIREQTVFMGNFPMMTEQGTFIINGTERVIVTQLVRSPGAYLMEAKDATKQVFTANLMPSRGSWLELEIDKKGAVYARIDRKRKLPITTLLRALPKEDPSTGFEIDTSSNEAILALFDNSVYIANTLEKDATTREEEAVIEVFKKQRPGEPPTLENARNLLRGLFFDPKRYDLTKVGRYKLNQRLEVDAPDDVRVLTTQDIVALVRKLVDLPKHLGVPEDSKDYAADAIGLSRDPIRKELDEYEHFGNRRLRTVGELIQEAFRVGLYRMERVVRERMTTEDVDTITPQTIINVRPVQAALKEFFGSSQLSQFMDQTNSLAGSDPPAAPLGARRGRSHARARADRGARRPRDPLRAHVPDRDARGPNIGLIGSLASYGDGLRVRLRPDAVPGRQGRQGHRRDRLPRRERGGEVHDRPGERAGRPEDRQVRERPRPLPAGGGEYVSAEPKDIQYMDVNPAQIVSVATALIPFLEHNDANRALMGANMQRQAVPLLITEPPLVGTGLEYRAAVDTGDVVLASRAGTVVDVDAEQIVVETKDGKDEYELVKFMRSNQGTLIHQKAIVNLGQKVDGARSWRTAARPPTASWRSARTCSSRSCRSRATTSRMRSSSRERLVKDDMLSSIHIHEYEIDARSTKLGDEEITRDIPNRSEESLKDLDDRGIVRIGAEVGSGDLLVGKVTPKGETELTAEEKLIRAIFKEKAREVRDTSLKVPHGEGGKVIAVKTFSRDGGRRPLAGRQRARARLRREEAQGRRGRQARRTPRQQGRDREDRARGGHAVPRGRHAGRRRAEPARRTEPDEHRPGARDASRLGGAHGVFAEDGERQRPDAGRDARSSTAPRRSRSTRRSSSGRGRTRTRRSTSTVDEKRPEGRDCSGKVRLFDGRTGEPFDQKVTVGYMYILKLLHLVDDKIHARSTGPYSLVTQQPLGGKAQFGGQRFGEMEVWALEAYGAAYTLQEMLTIKSDDTVGRVKAYEAIVKGENIAEPSIPESFKVLLKEMQSLALDVQVLSEEGGEVEVREEEDELLRAAEELGIDLSPGSLRAAARQPTAEELEEGQERADETGELTLPADEELGDLEPTVSARRRRGRGSRSGRRRSRGR